MPKSRQFCDACPFVKSIEKSSFGYEMMLYCMQNTKNAKDLPKQPKQKQQSRSLYILYPNTPKNYAHAISATLFMSESDENKGIC